MSMASTSQGIYYKPRLTFKLLNAHPDPDMPLHLEIDHYEAGHLRSVRVAHPGGEEVGPGLTVYDEVYVESLPLSADLGQVMLACYELKVGPGIRRLWGIRQGRGHTVAVGHKVRPGAYGGCGSGRGVMSCCMHTCCLCCCGLGASRVLMPT